MWGVKVNPDIHRFDVVSKASSVTTIADYDKTMINTVLEESTSSSFRRLCKHWKMFLVIIIPISAMIILSAFSLSRASDTLSVTSRALNSIEESVKFVTLVRNLQQERGLSTSFLGASNLSWASILHNLEKLQERTDTSLNRVNWPQNGVFILDRHWKFSEILFSLSAHRDSVKNKTITILMNLEYYTLLTSALMKYITQSVAIPDDSQVQRLIVASGALLSWTDSAGIQRALGTIFFSSCGWSSNDMENQYVILHGKAVAQFETALHFSPNIETRLNEIKMTFPNVSDFIANMESYQLFKNYISNCSLLTNEEKANKSSLWFNNMTYYIDTVFRLHGEIDVDISTKLEALHSDSQFEFSLFLSTLLVVIIVSGIMSTWYLYCIAQLTGNLSKYAKKVQLKSEELAKEKKKTDNLLYQMLPKKIAVNLKLGKSSPAEHFSQVTIYFSDIVGFTTIGAQSEPIQIVNMLNDLYSLFDQCIDKYDVYKVETIGDAYMVASGVPTPNGSVHAPEIAMMALRIRHDVRNYTVPHMPGRELQIRIGIHTGGKIHISNTTHALLCSHGNFVTEFRGVIDIKGKGPMATYWLERLEIEESEALVTLQV